MLSISIVEEIDRLLADGDMTQIDIARKLGVSRGTVNAIANGRRGLHGREERKKEVDAEPGEMLPERCARCGYLVQMPCRICTGRAQRERLRMMALAFRRMARRRQGKSRLNQNLDGRPNPRSAA